MAKEPSSDLDVKASALRLAIRPVNIIRHKYKQTLRYENYLLPLFSRTGQYVKVSLSQRIVCFSIYFHIKITKTATMING